MAPTSVAVIDDHLQISPVKRGGVRLVDTDPAAVPPSRVDGEPTISGEPGEHRPALRAAATPTTNHNHNQGATSCPTQLSQAGLKPSTKPKTPSAQQPVDPPTTATAGHVLPTAGWTLLGSSRTDATRQYFAGVTIHKTARTSGRLTNLTMAQAVELIVTGVAT